MIKAVISSKQLFSCSWYSVAFTKTYLQSFWETFERDQSGKNDKSHVQEDLKLLSQFCMRSALVIKEIDKTLPNPPSYPTNYDNLP